MYRLISEGTRIQTFSASWRSALIGVYERVCGEREKESEFFFPLLVLLIICLLHGLLSLPLLLITCLSEPTNLFQDCKGAPFLL